MPCFRVSHKVQKRGRVKTKVVSSKGLCAIFGAGCFPCRSLPFWSHAHLLWRRFCGCLCSLSLSLYIYVYTHMHTYIQIHIHLKVYNIFNYINQGWNCMELLDRLAETRRWGWNWLTLAWRAASHLEKCSAAKLALSYTAPLRRLRRCLGHSWKD